MIKRLFLLLFLNISLNCVTANAQIKNGSFSSGLTNWTALGAPTAGTWSSPTGSTTDAQIISTDAAHYVGSPNAPGSDTATDIEQVLDTTLPNSDIIFGATDGQALYQTFILTVPATLTFEYASSSTDYSYQDEVGYVLNGAYTELSHSTSYMAVNAGLLQAGTYTLGFVAYNTNDNEYDTDLFVSDVDLTSAPEPATWCLMALTAVSALGFARGRASAGLARV